LGFFKFRARRQVAVIYQYWDSDPPPDIESWMNSWLSAQPEFKLEHFDDSRARKFIADQIGSDAESAYLACRAPAMKADFFRYCALFASGGVYVDAGTVYRGGLADLYAKGDRGVLLRRTAGPAVKLINGFMIAKHRGDPLMKFAIDSAITNIRERKSQSVWDVTGPGILRRAHASEARPELFSGFEILDMHSAPVRRVFAFQRRENKIGPKDWRRMRDAGETIYAERLPRLDAGSGDEPVRDMKRAVKSNTVIPANNPDSKKKLAFLHIPKSGGVSIEQVLKKHFSHDTVAPYYFPHEYAKLDKAAVAVQYRLIIGHFDYDLIKQLDRTFTKAVLFREPLQLVVSLYNHAASRPAHRLHAAISSGELPFAKFCRVGGANNILSKYLLGRSVYFELTANGLNEEVIEKAVATARAHLGEFDCIGMLNEIDRFGRMLSSAVGIDALEIPKLNSPQTKRVGIHELTPTERHCLETANRLDLAIYDAVVKGYETGDWRSGSGDLP
jgi:hypothetical protein